MNKVVPARVKLKFSTSVNIKMTPYFPIDIQTMAMETFLPDEFDLYKVDKT